MLQFTDKLEDMLDNLTVTAEQVKHAEPISAHPDKLREQIEENKVRTDLHLAFIASEFLQFLSSFQFSGVSLYIGEQSSKL